MPFRAAALTQEPPARCVLRLMAGYALFTFVAMACLGVSIWAIADAASSSTDAFKAANSSRKRWLMLLVFFTLALDVIGVILAVVYLTVVRPRVKTARLRLSQSR